MPRPVNQALIKVLTELLKRSDLPAQYRQILIAIRNVENKRGERALSTNTGILALEWERLYDAVAEYLGLGADYMAQPLKVVRKIEKEIGRLINRLNPFKSVEARDAQLAKEAERAAPIAIVLAVLGAIFLLLDIIEYGTKFMKWAGNWYKAISLVVTKGAVSKMMRDIQDVKTDVDAIDLIEKMKDDPASQRAFFLLYGDQPTVETLVKNNEGFGDKKLKTPEFELKPNQQEETVMQNNTSDSTFEAFLQQVEAQGGQKGRSYGSGKPSVLARGSRGKVKIAWKLARLIYKGVTRGSAKAKLVFTTIAKANGGPIGAAASTIAKLFDTKIVTGFYAWIIKNPRIWGAIKALLSYSLIEATVGTLFELFSDEEPDEILDRALEAMNDLIETEDGDTVVGFLLALAAADDDGNDAIITVPNVSADLANLVPNGGRRTRGEGDLKMRLVNAEWIDELIAAAQGAGVTIPGGMTGGSGNSVSTTGTDPDSISMQVGAQLGLSGREMDHLRAMMMRAAVSMLRGIPPYEPASQLAHAYDVSINDALRIMKSIDLSNPTVVNAAQYINAPFSYRY